MLKTIPEIASYLRKLDDVAKVCDIRDGRACEGLLTRMTALFEKQTGDPIRVKGGHYIIMGVVKDTHHPGTMTMLLRPSHWDYRQPFPPPKSRIGAIGQIDLTRTNPFIGRDIQVVHIGERDVSDFRSERYAWE